MKPEPIGYYCPVCGEHRVNPDAGHGVGFVSIYNHVAPKYCDPCDGQRRWLALHLARLTAAMGMPLPGGSDGDPHTPHGDGDD